MNIRPNSIAMYCAAGARRNVEAALTAALESLQPIELTVELSANGTSITHYGGHIWLKDNELKAVMDIPGLTIQGAVLASKPRDNWLSAIKAADVLPVVKQELKPGVPDVGKFKVAPREEPKNVARIVAAKTAFDVKDKEPKPKPPEVPTEPSGKPKDK